MPGPQIVVIGLGATGSAALCQLARRGARAIGIEQFQVGHHRGSSHGPTRIFRLAPFENVAYVPLLLTTGIAELGAPDGELVRGTLAASVRHHLRHEVLDALALMRRYPQFKLPRNYITVTQP